MNRRSFLRYLPAAAAGVVLAPIQLPSTEDATTLTRWRKAYAEKLEIQNIWMRMQVYPPMIIKTGNPENIPLDLSPGTINYLSPDDDVRFIYPGGIDPDLERFRSIPW